MQRLFSYIESKTKTKFHGAINIPFQNGKLGNIKVVNVLSLEQPFEVSPLASVFGRIDEWIKLCHYGTIEIPFQNGVIGKPKECRVLKPEEL